MIIDWLAERKIVMRFILMVVELRIRRLNSKVSWLGNLRHLVKSSERKARLTQEWAELSARLVWEEKYGEWLRDKIAGKKKANLKRVA